MCVSPKKEPVHQRPAHHHTHMPRRLLQQRLASAAASAALPASPAVRALYRSLVGISKTFDDAGTADASRALLSSAPGVPGALDAFLGRAALYTPSQSDHQSMLGLVRSAFRQKVREKRQSG